MQCPEPTDEQDECPICLTEMNHSMWLGCCKHSFHGVCVLKWLHDNQSCPMCRLLARETPEVFFGSEFETFIVNINFRDKRIELVAEYIHLGEDESDKLANYLSENCGNMDMVYESMKYDERYIEDFSVYASRPSEERVCNEEISEIIEACNRWMSERHPNIQQIVLMPYC